MYLHFYLYVPRWGLKNIPWYGDTTSPLQRANPSLLLCLTLLPDVQLFPLRCPKPPPPPPSMSKLFPLQCPNPSHFLWPTLPSPCLTPPPLRCPHPSPSSVQTLSYSYVQPLPPHYVQLYSFDVQTLPLLHKNVNKQLPLYIPSQENNIPFMNLQKGFL